MTLSRKIDEVILIDHPAGRIEVMVTSIRGNKVRLGITAPKEIQVHRLEVARRIELEGRRKRA